MSSSLPKIIASQSSDQPPNTTLVRVGFSSPLNWSFVAVNSESQTQILKYLPSGIAYGLGIDSSLVTVQSLQPLQAPKLAYVATLALIFIPSNRVDDLVIHLQSSKDNRMYQNPDANIKALMSLIDPAISVQPADSNPAASNTSTAAWLQSGSTRIDSSQTATDPSQTATQSSSGLRPTTSVSIGMASALD